MGRFPRTFPAPLHGTVGVIAATSDSGLALSHQPRIAAVSRGWIGDGCARGDAVEAHARGTDARSPGMRFGTGYRIGFWMRAFCCASDHAYAAAASGSDPRVCPYATASR